MAEMTVHWSATMLVSLLVEKTVCLSAEMMAHWLEWTTVHLLV